MAMSNQVSQISQDETIPSIKKRNKVLRISTTIIILILSAIIQFLLYRKSTWSLQNLLRTQQSHPSQTEKALKVFIYEIPNQLLQAGRQMDLETCPFSFYSVEIVFPRALNGTRWHLSTQEDASELEGIFADYYLVPHYSTCYYNLCVREAAPEVCRERTSDYMANILDHIQQKYPFWQRKQGRDHLFVLSYDWGVHLFGEARDSLVRARLASSIHLTLMGMDDPQRRDLFDPRKDLTIPPWRDFSIVMNTPRPDYRPIFAYFRGTINAGEGYGKGIRGELAKFAELYPQRYFVKEGHSVFYWHELVHSKFALCPPGWSHWSPRLFDALLSGTIPVLLSDEWILPFNQTLINYDDLVIRPGEANLASLTRTLIAIPPGEEARMRKSMAKVQERFFYNIPSQNNDATDSIMQMLAQRSVPSWPRPLFTIHNHDDNNNDDGNENSDDNGLIDYHEHNSDEGGKSSDDGEDATHNDI